jgi:monoamine oxidase
VNSIATFDSERVEVHLNSPVSEIKWRPGYVRAAGFEADAAIVTVPLGVLQSHAIRFVPALTEKLNAAHQLMMGNVVKVVLCFRSAFWEDRGLMNLSFLHARGEKFPTWWTTRPVAAPILVGWAGGPPADALAGHRTDFIVHAAIESLANALKMDFQSIERRIRASFVADWQIDPFSMGAYSWVPVGSIAVPLALAEPVSNTLYFAGEATNSDGSCGTMHGAIATGHRAADELLRAFQVRAA